MKIKQKLQKKKKKKKKRVTHNTCYKVLLKVVTHAEVPTQTFSKNQALQYFRLLLLLPFFLNFNFAAYFFSYIPFTMSKAILSDFGTELVIPVCALIGIVFAIIQWLVVSKVKVQSDYSPANRHGCDESLIQDVDGINNHYLVERCANIQRVIYQGKFIHFYFLALISVLLFCIHVFLFQMVSYSVLYATYR